MNCHAMGCQNTANCTVVVHGNGIDPDKVIVVHFFCTEHRGRAINKLLQLHNKSWLSVENGIVMDQH